MRTEINHKLRYIALLCGTRGDCITMPGEAVIDMSAQGSVDEAVAYRADKIPRDPALTPDRLAKILKEQGAWDAEQLKDDAANWHRALWIAACNCAEDDNPEIADPATQEERDALVAQRWADDPDAREGCAWDLVDRIRTMDAEEWDALLGGCGLRCTREELQTFLVNWGPFNAWTDGVVERVMDDGHRPEWVHISRTEVSFEPIFIAETIDLGASGFQTIALKADRNCWKKKHKDDIRKLCIYLGCGHVADKAVSRGITRVPKILELAGAIR